MMINIMGMMQNTLLNCLIWFNQILNAIPLSRSVIYTFFFFAILFGLFIVPLRGYASGQLFGGKSDSAKKANKNKDGAG